MDRQVQVGQLVAGKYRIEQTLGRGGMGVVMAALHEQLNQRVALKFLTDEAYQQPEAVARFLREARAAVQIQSEHVARVMDVGTLESGAPYMVMEYLRGRDLKEVSTRRGPLPFVEAVDYLLQACDAVAEAHALGIVHRDLKPSNLFLTERADGSPLVKVLDFGISKALHKGDSSQMQMTASAAIMGSPQYMSPEQIRSSKNVDARADVWALGTILHELLTGSPAYVADTVPGLLAMIVADPPPPLSASRADAPPELEAAILRCLEKDRDRRFANVAEFARSIERFASTEARPLVRRIARILGENAPAPSVSLPAATLSHTFPDPMGQGQTNGTWARTGRIHGAGGMQRLGIGLLAVFGVAGMSIGGWAFFRERGTEEAQPPGVSLAGAAAVPPPAAAALELTPASPSPARPNPTEASAPPSSVGVRPVESGNEPGAIVAAPGKEDPMDESVFVKEAKSTVDTEPSATKGKRRPVTTSRPSRGRESPARPQRPATTPRAAEPATSPAPAPKKSDGTDLFNDTK